MSSCATSVWYQNGRQGIAINRSRHVLVDRAYMQYSRRAAIDLEPDTAGETICDIEIRNSDLGSNLLAISSAGAGRREPGRRPRQP